MAGDAHIFEVDAASAGARLDRFVTERIPRLSRSQVGKLIRDGHVSVGARRPKAGLELRSGETVSVEVPDTEPSPVEPVDRPLEVMHEDASLAVVVKPADLAVHPAAGGDDVTLVHVLLARLDGLSSVGGVERPGIVHRLDKDTTGVMVVAKTDAAHRELARQFHDREVDKLYEALVVGCPRAESGTIDRPVGRHPSEPGRMSSLESRAARDAVTAFRRTEALGPAALLELRPRTGRTHQIRVHLADEGHPIVGDVRYGFDRRVRGVGDVRVRRALERARRPLLHARALAFDHPDTRERLRFEAPRPDDFEAVVNAVRGLVSPGERR